LLHYQYNFLAMTQKEAIYFKYHPDAEAIWFTVDGQAFMTEQRAKEHNSTLTNGKRGGAIIMRTRAQYEVFAAGLAAAEKASDAPAAEAPTDGAKETANKDATKSAAQ
jgi:hypothetical protein